MKKMLMFARVCVAALCVSARPGPGGFGGLGRGGFGPMRGPGPIGGHHHHHHHRGGTALGIGAGILGAGLVASTSYEATHPRPVIVAPAPVIAPAPVVVAQPTVVTPAPVVVQPAGHYETRVQNVWVEGRYIDQSYNGVIQRVWQPGHYEQQQTQVWVTP